MPATEFNGPTGRRTSSYAVRRASVQRVSRGRSPAPAVEMADGEPMPHFGWRYWCDTECAAPLPAVFATLGAVGC